MNDDVVETEAVEQRDVCRSVPLVGSLQTGVVNVEGVGVLHGELPPAQQPGSWTGLVAIFDLNLIKRQRQLLIGREHVLHREGEHLFVRRAEQHVDALAVGQPEEVVAVFGPTTRGLVGLTGKQRGEADFLTPDGVHLFAHDLFHVAQHPQAQRQPSVDPRGGTADVAGPDQQFVSGQFGVGRVLAQRAEKEGGQAQGHVGAPRSWG